MKLISKKRLQELREVADMKTNKEIKEYGIAWCYEMSRRYPSSTPIWPIYAMIPVVFSFFCWTLIQITQTDWINFILVPLLIIVVIAVWALLSKVLCGENLETRITKYECLLWLAAGAYIPMFQSQINDAINIAYEHAKVIQFNFGALSFGLAIYLAITYNFFRHTVAVIASIVAIGILVKALNFLAIPYVSELLYLVICASLPVLLSHRVSSIRSKLINEQRIMFRNVRSEQIAKGHVVIKHYLNMENEALNEKNIHEESTINKNRARNNSRRSSRKRKKR